MNEKAGKVAGGKGSAIEILQACGPHACVSLELAENTLSRRWWWSRKATQSCSAFSTTRDTLVYSFHGC